MERRRSTLISLLLIGLAIVLVLGVSACSSADSGTSDDNGSTTATDSTDAADPAVTLIESKCSMCHSTDRVWAADKTREQWITTVDRMKANGLVVTDAEYNQIVDYLSNQ